MFKYTNLLIILYIFITIILFALSQNGIHSKEDNSPKDYIENKEEKLIFYDVNPLEDFYSRLDVYTRFAIMLSQAPKSENWQLVLPPWYGLHDWKYTTEPIPWGEFFNLDSLKSYAPVLELWEVFARRLEGNLTIDRIYLLQNHSYISKEKAIVDKWEMDTETSCVYNGQYWGYNNITAKEVTCIKFQGKISQLWQIVALHPEDKKIMFAHGNIPLHDSRETTSFWDCRKSMKFNNDLLDIAEHFMVERLICNCERCTIYIAVDWRRCHENKNILPSITRTVDLITQTIKGFNFQRHLRVIETIFIATNATSKEHSKLQHALERLEYQVFSYIPSKKQGHEGHVAIINLIICSRAYYFLGMNRSEFTYRVQEEREIAGYHSDTTFKMICPEGLYCELWTPVCPIFH